ncbi:MAG: DUF2269 family protein [Chloroflexota bacterium]
MIDLSDVLKVIHALVGIGLISGLSGRWITLTAARRATDLPAVRTLLALSDRFERMAISSSILVLVLGIATALAKGEPFLGPLQGAGINWLFAALVIYLSVIPLVPLVFLPRGRTFDAALQDAISADRVTPGLTAAFRDPVVLAAHTYEFGAITLVLILMIAKPF